MFVKGIYLFNINVVVSWNSADPSYTKSVFINKRNLIYSEKLAKNRTFDVVMYVVGIIYLFKALLQRYISIMRTNKNKNNIKWMVRKQMKDIKARTTSS